MKIRNFFASTQLRITRLRKYPIDSKAYLHTGQCKHTGGCYNELVVAFFSTGGGVKRKKIYTC